MQKRPLFDVCAVGNSLLARLILALALATVVSCSDNAGPCDEVVEGGCRDGCSALRGNRYDFERGCFEAERQVVRCYANDPEGYVGNPTTCFYNPKTRVAWLRVYDGPGPGEGYIHCETDDIWSELSHAEACTEYQ